MIAIILAAGLGSRLKLKIRSKFGFSIPFLLLNTETLGREVPFSDEFLVENVFRAFQDRAPVSYLFVLGYRFVENSPVLAYLAQKYGVRLHYVVNPWFAKTNTAYSLHLALEALLANGYEDDLLIINGDNYLSSAAWQKIRQKMKEGRSFLVVDQAGPLTAESFKIKLEGSRILEMGKHLDPEESNGEFIGVSFLKKDLVPKLAEAVRELVSTNLEEYYDRAFIPLSQGGLLDYVFLSAEEPWTEIDFPEDLNRLAEILRRENEAP